MRTTLALLLVLLGHSTYAAVISGPITNPANGHVYYLLSQNTWTESEAEATGLGGHLVSINDAQENEWVVSQFATFGGINRYLWIGLTDAADEGVFTWSSGEPLTYENWGSGEPVGGSMKTMCLSSHHLSRAILSGTISRT